MNSLLLVLPVPIFEVDGRLFYDGQATNGTRLWLENFDRVVLCCPLIRADRAPETTIDLMAALPTERLVIDPLPLGWSPPVFLRALAATSRKLGRRIDEATHLQFAIGGLWGDWGAVAALIAARRGRKAAVWTDRVESEVMAIDARRHRGIRRLYRSINARLSRLLERIVIRRSAMGLFHGMDTFTAYAPFSRDAHLVHDIHLGPEARIDPSALAAKVARPADPLRVIYVGRAHGDKGPLDWVEAMALLAAAGISLEAVWYGDGPELEAARAETLRRTLATVSFPGALNDRAALMAAIKDADLFAFCHKTPESPRCLIEALLGGTPIVGYESAYAADLIAGHGGGVLVAHTPAALAEAIAALAADVPRLKRLAEQAARDGNPMVDEEVFRHRSDLIKTLGAAA